MNYQIVLATLAVVLCAASPARAQSRDEHLQVDVTRSVATYGRYTVFDDVRALVEGGTVTLSGKVTLDAKKDELGKRITALAGVTAVRNEIEVLRSLPSDDELRHRLARAIYGNAAFWRYAAMQTPPIRILVDRGRVTLTGVVATESDRVLARSLATGVGDVSVTCDLMIERAGR